MARRFRSSRTFTTRSQRRLTDWIGGVSASFNESQLNAGVAAIISSFDTRIAGNEGPFTITRTLGYLGVAPSATTAEQFAHGAFGIQVISGEAFDAGIAAMPTPFSESGDERWHVFFYWSMMYAFNVGAGGTSHSRNPQMNFDSKAQRRVDTGDVIVAVIENGASTDAVDFLSNNRLLVKVH